MSEHCLNWHDTETQVLHIAKTSFSHTANTIPKSALRCVVSVTGLATLKKSGSQHKY